MKLMCSLLLISLAAPVVAAEKCDTEATLERLQTEVVGVLDDDQKTQARAILAALCDPEQKEEPTKVLGVEIKPAEEDSRGHDRLRRRY